MIHAQLERLLGAYFGPELHWLYRLTTARLLAADRSFCNQENIFPLLLMILAFIWTHSSLSLSLHAGGGALTDRRPVP